MRKSRKEEDARRQAAMRAAFPQAALLSLLLILALALSACGRREQDQGGWLDDPIVPGYSAAEIEMGSSFSAVLEVHGEPEDRRKEGSYLYAYYQRTREGGGIDDPASWLLVVTLYDQGNGYLDPEDEVGAVEVSSPYAGKTSGGVGIGSTAQDVEGEFGPCPVVSTTASPEGGELLVYSYMDRGVEFVLSEEGKVLTVMVTAYGGLRPAEERSGGGEGAEGVFGSHRSDPILPGQSAAGIRIGDEFLIVRELYGDPDVQGSTTEGLVYAAYTGGYGTWKLAVYLEDRDKGDSLDDFDVVVSISLRFPYAGRTPKGVGIGSLQSDVIREFGAPENQNTALHQGEQTTILEYNSKGIVFAVRTASAEVVEIDVNRAM